MMMRFLERIGTRRAASQLRRMGYAQIADNLENRLTETD